MHTENEENSNEGNMTGVFSQYGRITKPTYKEQAYRLIKEAILYHRFKQNAIYSQEAICQELGVSRTPVREALLELQKEGYIIFCRGRGIQIVALDDKSIRDILEMRLYLETAAAGLAARRADHEDLDHIRRCLDACYKNLESESGKKDIARSYRLDHQFHRAILSAAHNDLLRSTLDDVLDRYLRFEVQTVYNNTLYANEIMKEHSAIFWAVEKRCPEEAEKCAQTHLTDAYRRTLSKYWN